MNSIRFTITEPFHFTVKVPMIAANFAARLVGAAMVLAPVMAIAAVITVKPAEISVPLPLTIHTISESRYFSINDKELDCLANNIYYEARNQSELGQLAVGLVTVTRAKHEKWSKTICGVVYEPKQFTWTWDKKQNLKAHDDSLQYLHALNLASRILAGDFESTREMFTADYYHTTAVHPGWARKMERVAIIDNHIFYVDQ